MPSITPDFRNRFGKTMKQICVAKFLKNVPPPLYCITGGKKVLVDASDS